MLENKFIMRYYACNIMSLFDLTLKERHNFIIMDMLCTFLIKIFTKEAGLHWQKY